MSAAQKFHPLTGAPIVPLGYRKDGRAIWPILGGSEDPTPPTEPAQEPQAPASAPETPAAAPEAPEAGKGGKEAVLADLAKERDRRQELEQRLADLEAATKAQQQRIANALGFEQPEEAAPDPAALAAQIEAEKATARTAQVQLAVYKAAGSLDANAARLLDSASFLTSLADVDPTDADAVRAAITAAVEADPVFKATPAAPQTPPFPGGPRPTQPSASAESLEGAIQARLSSQGHR